VQQASLVGRLSEVVADLERGSHGSGERGRSFVLELRMIWSAIERIRRKVVRLSAAVSEWRRIIWKHECHVLAAAPKHRLLAYGGGAGLYDSRGAASDLVRLTTSALGDRKTDASAPPDHARKMRGRKRIFEWVHYLSKSGYALLKEARDLEWVHSIVLGE